VPKAAPTSEYLALAKPIAEVSSVLLSEYAIRPSVLFGTGGRGIAAGPT